MGLVLRCVVLCCVVLLCLRKVKYVLDPPSAGNNFRSQCKFAIQNLYLGRNNLGKICYAKLIRGDCCCLSLCFVAFCSVVCCVVLCRVVLCTVVLCCVVCVCFVIFVFCMLTPHAVPTISCLDASRAFLCVTCFHDMRPFARDRFSFLSLVCRRASRSYRVA